MAGGPVTPPYEYTQAVLADLRDDLAAAREQAGAWQDHAVADCAALGRAWQAAANWDEVAARNPGDLGRKITGLDPATLRACADMLRQRIIGPAPPGCGLPGCAHHYQHHLDGCTCPAWFDSGGYHTVFAAPGCPAHRMTSEGG